ncbi:MAG: alpha/beta hydrolase fold [Cereibacter sp.]|jgi:pimeloyl-ACP methyl ester carboxylesterase|nr:alpha/beta hydrolase fold [Cereibacter sp.]
MTHREFTASDGTRLAYTDEGEGLPLLCLPGLTRTGGDFDYLAPHLPGVRLIRPDYRGRGASSWSGAASYTVPQEARDVLELLDHLGLGQAAVLGTSRGGLIGMMLAAVARERLLGLCLNDVGPVIERAGLERIFDYVGRNPAARSHAALAEALPRLMTGFANVPPERWLAEARLHYRETPQGLRITYDPALREAFLAAFEGETPDLWPLFDACAGLPLALIRGANSDLLSEATVAEMRRRRPDMICAEVPDRAHIPFLDEPESLAAIHAFLKALP